MTENRNHANIRRVWALLENVPDPEIPQVSVVELGMIGAVDVDNDRVTVRLTPTFAACPAVAYIQNHIKNELAFAGYKNVTVEVVYDPPWTTDRITPAGLKKLQEFGLAIPNRLAGKEVEMSDLQHVACPHCHSTDTSLESTFGPTLCRAIHYCNACKQSFEQFKPVS